MTVSLCLFVGLRLACGCWYSTVAAVHCYANSKVLRLCVDVCLCVFERVCVAQRAAESEGGLFVRGKPKVSSGVEA